MRRTLKELQQLADERVERELAKGLEIVLQVRKEIIIDDLADTRQKRR